jgi:hypothetical protein
VGGAEGDEEEEEEGRWSPSEEEGPAGAPEDREGEVEGVGDVGEEE